MKRKKVFNWDDERCKRMAGYLQGVPMEHLNKEWRIVMDDEYREIVLSVQNDLKEIIDFFDKRGDV